MHPEIERQLAKVMVEELRRGVRPSKRNTMSAPRANGSLDGEVVIRASRPSDVPALHALAALDGVVAPLGTVLVAEVTGSIVAALAKDSAPVVAEAWFSPLTKPVTVPVKAGLAVP